MEVWEFQKTFVTRLKEYRSVFDSFNQNTSIVGFSSTWATFLSNTLHQHSWIAVWCLSHQECFEHNLHAPTRVNVTVLRIDYDELTACISVHSVEGSLEKISGKCAQVSLIDLYVAKQQKSDDVDFEAIANCLDQLRIFYHYLIWPWEEDIEYKFVNFLPKIESRLHLYYDIVDGSFNRTAQKNFLALVSRGKKIYKQMRALTSESPDKVDPDEDLSVSMNLYNRLRVIQYRLGRFEDSKMRKHVNLLTSVRRHGPSCHVILPGVCDISSTVELFARVKKMLPHADCKSLSRSLGGTLEKYDSDDTILVSPDVHRVDSERLDWNVTIRGLCPDQKSIITDATSCWYFLKTTGDNVILRDLVVNLQRCQAAVFVSEGVTELDSVLMKVERSTASVAVVVEYNASLVANRCRFVDFDVAIFCLPGSAVELTDCVFENNETCVEIIAGAQVCMVDCDLSLCKDGCVKYSGGFDKNQLKSLDSLSSIDTISFRSVKVHDESKAVMFV